MARSPPRRRHNGQPRDYRDNRSDLRRSSSRDRRHDDRYREREQYDSRRDRDRDRDLYGGRRDDRHSNRYDGYQSPRRDRSRERKRSRERGPSPVRDSRHHSRENYRRDRDDYNDRDRKRRKRDPSSNRSEQSRPSAADVEAAAAEEAKKAKNRAKVEAWKKSRLQPQVVTEASNALHSPTPAVASPVAGSPAASLPTATEGSPAPVSETLFSDNRPRQKFDHKEIRRRATEKPQQTKKVALGDDAMLPAQAYEKAEGRHVSDTQQPAHARTQAGSKVEPGNSKISGFGLNTSIPEKSTEKLSTDSARALDDDDVKVKREFKKLPDLPQAAESSDGQHVYGPEGPGDDDSADDLLSDDEEAEAALKAIQKRAEQAEIKETDKPMTDVDTADTSMRQGTTPSDAHMQNVDSNQPDLDDEEEVDPLDAFMSNLHQTTSTSGARIKSGVRHSRGAQILAQDEGGSGDEVLANDNSKDPLNPKRVKKEVPVVDHSKIQYDDFRKDFYTESPELASMTDDEIEALRAEMDNIKIDDQSKSVPTPISKWAQGGFGTQILDVLRSERLDAPTSIQSQALPAIMSGRDFIGIAKTGSGKTLAFILPMFRHIQDQPRVTHMDGPIGLILAPTRELAVQIFRMCKPYLKALNLRGVCAYGGAPIKDQIADLKRGAEVIVCTPGRMIDLLAANSGRVTNLRRVTYCVLDEADRMFDMGFEPQITRILTNIRPDRQVVLFSATFPAKMEGLAKKATRNRILITVGGRSVVAPEITQIVEVLPEAAKFRRVLELLGRYLYEDDGRRVVIFVERQETADTVFVNLGQHQYPSVPVHGGREQIDRDQAISDFKAGHYPILVATSVAARGLDVKQLDLVIQYDCPNHAEDYVHRAGRTGRAGNKGTAITFVTPEQERYAPFIVRALEESNQDVPDDLREMASAFKQKLKAGEAQKTGSGFGGKGIERLEAARVAERNRERKQFKTGDDPDSDDETENKPEVKIAEKIAKATGVIRERDAQPSSTTLSAELTDKIRNAMNVTKRETPPESADPMARVQAAAAGISSRLTSRGTTRPGAPGDNRGPDAGAYHTTLEINDFPQKARWAVTNRANVSKILDATGTSITTKGIYYPKGQHPGPGDEPELFILIEGDTELVVQKAVKLLSEHLEKGTDQAHELEARQARTGGRYNVPVS